MLPALGHCEDPSCLQSTSRELARLFRCSIHCDLNLCLFHLNAHNVYYEEQKKQNDVVMNELENNLSIYKTIFEQQVRCYREIVRQASSILLHNQSSLVPIDHVRPILEKIQQAIALYQEEQIIIKCEPTIDLSEIENEKQKVVDDPPDVGQKVVLRIPRIVDHNAEVENNNSESNENQIESEDSSEHGRKRKSSVKRFKK